MSISAVLQRITTALDQSSAAYMLTGSFASAYYDTPRSTQDIDVVVEASADQLRAFVNSLPVDQYYSDLDVALQAHRAESMFNVVDRSNGWKLDFIIRKSRPLSRENFVVAHESICMASLISSPAPKIL
jgi:predicted nucleotidyltransferase